jgi:hypothetical protein
MKNIGSIDKVVRVLVAALIAVLYFTHVISGTTGIILLVVAGVFVLTSLLGICPIYLLFGLKTAKKADPVK